MVTITEAQNSTSKETLSARDIDAKVNALAEELEQVGFRSDNTAGAGTSGSGANGSTASETAEEPQGTTPLLDSDDEDALPFGSEDPLYDEHADSEDETWVRDELLGGCEANEVTESVSCPSCFALLSMQVQQHMRYEGQFRALFVTNCKVIEKERLRITTDRLGRRPQSGEVFKPVVCRKCDTEVAVLDVDGVYHFCNVIY